MTALEISPEKSKQKGNNKGWLNGLLIHFFKVYAFFEVMVQGGMLSGLRAVKHALGEQGENLFNCTLQNLSTENYQHEHKVYLKLRLPIHGTIL